MKTRWEPPPNFHEELKGASCFEWRDVLYEEFRMQDDRIFERMDMQDDRLFQIMHRLEASTRDQIKKMTSQLQLGLEWYCGQNANAFKQLELSLQSPVHKDVEKDVESNLAISKAASAHAQRVQKSPEASVCFLQEEAVTTGFEARQVVSEDGSEASEVAAAEKRETHENGGKRRISKIDSGGQRRISETRRLSHHSKLSPAEKIRVRNELAEMGIVKDAHWTSCNYQLQRSVREYSDFMHYLREPDRTGFLARVVMSKSFEIVCGLAIAINSVFVAYIANWNVQNLDQQQPEWTHVAELSMVTFYIIEWLMRLAAHRCFFFTKKWNIFDTVVVFVSMLDSSFSLVSRGRGDDRQNLFVVRLLRFLKLTKILRAVRALRFFYDLSVMMESFVQSSSAFFWALVMLAFVFYLCALIFLQGIGDYLASLDQELEETKNEITFVRRYFGDVATCILSLFQTCTGGMEWSILYKILKKCGALYATWLILLIFFFDFAFLNIVTGIAVEKASRASRPARDDLVLTQRLEDENMKSEFKHLCRLFDPDDTGLISYDRFEQQMDNDIVLNYLFTLGLEVHEIRTFFEIVAGDLCQDRISIDRFVEGCMHMKGDASGVDMQKAIFGISLLREDLDKLLEQNVIILEALQNSQ